MRKIILTRSFSCFFAIVVCLIYMSLLSCRKMLDTPPPINSAETKVVFADSTLAAAALQNIYFQATREATLIRGQVGAWIGSSSAYGAISADEMIAGNSAVLDVYENSITKENAAPRTIWLYSYRLIYQCNAVIEGLEASTTIREDVKRQFIGEARFLRAITYFYLVNYFGDVPFVSNTDWYAQQSIRRMPVSDVYSEIVADLKYCYENTRTDYSISKGERCRANQWAAAAMLARVYLYMENWNEAERYAALLIAEQGLFGLRDSTSQVFLKNNSEIIFAVQNDPKVGTNYASPSDAMLFLSVPLNQVPNFYVYDNALSLFEPTDTRSRHWFIRRTMRGIQYLLLAKYKDVVIGSQQPSVITKEDNIQMRLAEILLIRAEANYRLNNFSQAVKDINLLRKRANVSLLANNLTGQALFDAIVLERRFELFGENGHRWFDLKRWHMADQILSPIKPKWKTTSVLFPIPADEIEKNVYLSQNPGY